MNDEDYEEIKNCAEILMNNLSKELNDFTRDKIMMYPDLILQYSCALSWLSGIVYYDWKRHVDRKAKELETVRLPETYRIDSNEIFLFKVIVRIFEKYSSVEIKQLSANKTLPIPMSLDDYIHVGWIMGFVIPFRTFFRRKRAFFLIERNIKME